MLTEFQQSRVWDAWLSAEIRAGYFAALSNKYQSYQKLLVFGTLLLSSGATFSLLVAIPAGLSWVRPVLTLLAAALSAGSLVAKNERSAIECSDLHFRWNTLAMEYEKLWANVWAEDAAETLDRLRLREAEISKSGLSMPEKLRLLEEVQDNVVMHHRELAA